MTEYAWPASLRPSRLSFYLQHITLRFASPTADSAGFPRIPPAFARAGDVVLAGDPQRLGVVVDGGRAAFVGPRGLVRQPLNTCTVGWRIG